MMQERDSEAVYYKQNEARVIWLEASEEALFQSAQHLWKSIRRSQIELHRLLGDMILFVQERDINT